MALRRSKQILITTGDTDGIGLEVSMKALARVKIPKDVQIFLFRSATGLNKSTRTEFESNYTEKFERVSTLKNAITSDYPLVEILSSEGPAEWVVSAAKFCLKGPLDRALVTGPLSKELILESGLNFIGHTQILASLSGKKELFMGFLGNSFSVVLATGHISLKMVPSQIEPKRLSQVLLATKEFLHLLPVNRAKKPIAWLGLNPHAGENGIIGNEEQILKEFLTRQNKNSSCKIVGPLVPDAAFLPQFWKKYSVYVANYHDQGLIPFKLVHGFNDGVHVTLGLPFVRTSVDHGTAKDIFGKNKANENSMLKSIEAAIKLVNRKRD